MTKVKRMISIFSILAVLFSIFSVNVSAASGKSRPFGVFEKKTIIVQTDKTGKPRMTFRCVGTGSYQYGAKAPRLSLRVKDLDTGKVEYYQVKGLGNTISSKLKLAAGKRYEIEVSYLYKSYNWGTYGSGMYKTTGYFEGNWNITQTSKLSYKIQK